MTTDNWISIISAILIGGGTLFLGIMAWRSIRQTRNIQKSERRERLLNEIIEWGKNMLESELSAAPLQAGLKDPKTLIKLVYFDLLVKYRKVNARSEYSIHIASNFKGALQSTVNKAADKLRAIIKLLMEHFDTVTEREIRELRESLETSALAVIEEATKIKTRDIG